MIPDSNKISSLYDLSFDDSDLPGSYARNLLISLDLINFDEPFIINPTLKSSRIIRNYSKSNPFCLLRVFPNPCSDYITIEYNIAESNENVLLVLYGSNGNIVESKLLHNRYDQIMLSVIDLKPGIYLVALRSGDKRLASEKFFVVR